MMPTMLSFWGWYLNTYDDWETEDEFDGTYTVVPGFIINSYFGVTQALDDHTYSLLIVHLPSGAGILWVESLQDAEVVVEKALMNYDVWDKHDPQDVIRDVKYGDTRQELDKLWGGTTVPKFLW